MDMEDSRQTTADNGRTKAIKLGARWAETSSKTGQNVDMLFQEVAKAVLERRKLAFRKSCDMSSRLGNMEASVEILTPTEEQKSADVVDGPFQLLSRLSTKRKTKGKRESSKNRPSMKRKPSNQCCQIS